MDERIWGVPGEVTAKFQGPSLEILWTKHMWKCRVAVTATAATPDSKRPLVQFHPVLSYHRIILTRTVTLPWQQSLLPTAWAEMDANKTPNWQRWLPSWHQTKIHQYFIGQAVESFPAREQPCRRLLQLKILPEQVSRDPGPGLGRPTVACYSHNIRLRDSVVHHVFRQFTDWVTGSGDHRPLPESSSP
jgi:hypothetical protein